MATTATAAPRGIPRVGRTRATAASKPRFQWARDFGASVKRGWLGFWDWFTGGVKAAWNWLTGPAWEGTKRAGRWARTQAKAVWGFTMRTAKAAPRAGLRVIAWPVRVLSRLGLFGWAGVIGALFLMSWLFGESYYVAREARQKYTDKIHTRIVKATRRGSKTVKVKGPAEVKVEPNGDVTITEENPTEVQEEPKSTFSPFAEEMVTLKIQNRKQDVPLLYETNPNGPTVRWKAELAVEGEQELLEKAISRDQHLLDALHGTSEKMQFELIQRIHQLMVTWGDPKRPHPGNTSWWFGKGEALVEYLNNPEEFFESKKPAKERAANLAKDSKAQKDDPSTAAMWQWLNQEQLRKGYLDEYERLAAIHAPTRVGV